MLLLLLSALPSFVDSSEAGDDEALIDELLTLRHEKLRLSPNEIIKEDIIAGRYIIGTKPPATEGQRRGERPSTVVCREIDSNKDGVSSCSAEFKGAAFDGFILENADSNVLKSLLENPNVVSVGPVRTAYVYCS